MPLTDKLRELFREENRVRLIVLLGIAGVAMILLSGLLPKRQNKAQRAEPPPAAAAESDPDARIFARFYALDFLPTDKASAGKNATGKNESCAEAYWKYAREVADSPKAYMHNEALMELGRTVCRSKNPDCANCPLNGGCRAFAEGRTGEFPPKRKSAQREWRGTALVVESADGKLLAVSAGQPFLAGQATLPHFESPRNATAGLPAEAEAYLNADNVVSIKECGSFRHNITVHKIECRVLHVKLSTKASKCVATDRGIGIAAGVHARDRHQTAQQSDSIFSVHIHSSPAV